MYQPGSMWSTQPLGMITGGRSHFYQHDQLGSPNLVTSNTGQIKWQGAMDAFGKVQTTTSDINHPLRFPGQYFDQESGLHYNMFRDYDPEIGRYIQSDPIGLAGGVNTYGYVGGNPVNFYDPLGLWSTGAHNYLIQQLGLRRGWSGLQIQWVQQGSYYADSFFRGKQSPENSFIHAMRSKANPTISGACKKANNYLNNKRKSFFDRGAGSSTDSVRNFEAYSQLGQGLHTVMDNRSPAHTQFQMWDSSQFGRHGDSIPLTAFGKNTEEDLNALLANPGLIDVILNDMETYIDNGSEIRCGCE
jgi:RHS repeat-associated protein